MAFWVVEGHQLGDGLPPVEANVQSVHKPVLKDDQNMSNHVTSF